MARDQVAERAKALKGNPLLAELIAERQEELRDSWTTEESAERRETLWHQMRATIELEDYLNGRIESLAGRGA